MKRIFCLVLSAVLLLGLIGVGASAEGQLKLVLTGGTAEPGQEIEVVLSVENNPGLKGISCYVEFDDSVLSYLGFTDKTGLGGWNMSSFADDHILMWYYDGIVSGQMQTYDGEELVALRFKVAEDAAPDDYAVSLSFGDWDSLTGVVDNYVYDYDFSEFETVAGKVTVPAPETLEDGYYLIGQKGWDIDAIGPELKFERNTNSADEEYLLEVFLTEGEQLKVVRVENGAIAQWYPDPGDNYTVEQEYAGTKTVYFRPQKKSDDNAWMHFGGHIYIGASLHIVEVYGSSLSLKGDIGLNFFLIVPNELQEDAGAYVMLNDTKYLISEASTREVDGTKLYQFSVKLAAKQMTEKVELRVYNGEGVQTKLVNHTTGEDVTATGYLYSVQDYVDKVHANSTDEKLIALVDAMLDYGALAQINFNNNTGNIPEVKAHLDEVTADTLAKYQEKVTVGAVPGLTYYGTSLVTESTTEINVYFIPDEGSELADFTFKVGSKVYTPVEKDGKWMIKIPNIAAKDLDKTYTVTVSTAEGTVVKVKTCALSYAYKVVTSDKNPDEALVNLVKGLYLYNQAANAYFG